MRITTLASIVALSFAIAASPLAVAGFDLAAMAKGGNGGGNGGGSGGSNGGGSHGDSGGQGGSSTHGIQSHKATPREANQAKLLVSRSPGKPSGRQTLP